MTDPNQASLSAESPAGPAVADRAAAPIVPENQSPRPAPAEGAGSPAPTYLSPEAPGEVAPPPPRRELAPPPPAPLVVAAPQALVPVPHAAAADDGGEAGPGEGAAPGGLPGEADYGPVPQTFVDMQLSEDVLASLREMGFSEPMPVQRRVYRPVLAGRDVIVQSRTGSGKTAAFGIPFVQALVDPRTDCKNGYPQALVLGPTRELALQVATEVGRIASRRGLEVVPVYGGAPMGRQVEQLKSGGHIVSGTPGRVLDHIRRGTLHLSRIKILVLDEADEMLSMGFLEDILEVIKRCPPSRQTMLFSATMSDDVVRLATRQMKSPLMISMASADGLGHADISHAYYMVSGMGRMRDLLRVLDIERPESAIIFCNTREETSTVAEFMRGHGLDAEAISSDLTQADRERVMARSKQKTLRFLVATDVAARGIDISDLSHVINYTFPESAEVYVHRTGRTGRAGKSGVAISLISPRELGNFYYLKLSYKIRPEERALPTEAEQQTLREGQYLDRLQRESASREPAGVFRSLLKRLLASEEGEKILAQLLETHLAQPAQAEAPRPPRPRRDESSERREDTGERRPPRDRDEAGERRPPRDESGERRPPRDESGERRPPRDESGERRPPRDESGERRPPRDRDRGPERDRRREDDRPRRRDDDRPRRSRDEAGERRRDDEPRPPRPETLAAEPPRAPEPPRAAEPQLIEAVGPESTPRVPAPAPSALAPPAPPVPAPSAPAAAPAPEVNEAPEGKKMTAPSAEAGSSSPEGDEGEGRRRRGRGRGRGERGEGRAPGVLAPGPDDIIHADDGREFWEAWADARAAAAPEAGKTAPEVGNKAGSLPPPPADAFTEGRRSARREESRPPAPPPPPVAPGLVRLYLNLGRRDGFEDQALQALLAEKGLTGLTTELHNSHTYLYAAEAQVDAVCAALSGQQFGTRTTICERARR